MSGPRLHLPLVLVGMPGSGKSRVGRALASRLCVPHLDSDDLVVEEAGTPITQIFSEQGEAGFRALEARAVERALERRAVISLGGGAVTTPEVRAMLRGHSVVHLDVAHEELLRRTAKKTHRPLLLPDPEEALRRLREERDHLYREVASVRVHSDSRPVTRVVEDILALMGGAPQVVQVRGGSAYPVLIGHDLLAQVVDGVRPEATRVLLVHPQVLSAPAQRLTHVLEERGLEVHALVHPDAEEGKTLDVASAGWDAAGAARLGRTDTVIGLGGGATTDVAGFIAATWLRGVDVVQVPTTLLGMVDAAVGGKTGINTAAGKNLVGAFHPPVRVVEDLDLLATLAQEDLRAGFGEVVKCGLIADAQILDLLSRDPAGALDAHSSTLRELVVRSVEVKAEVVGQDLTESGLREVLNYGHTLAHAIERCENYRWRHGDAVSVGCVFAAELACELGLLGEADVAAHRLAFDTLGLPTSYSGAPLEDLVDAMLSDKKVRGRHLRFVLLEGLQNPVVRRVEARDLRGPAQRVGVHVR